MFTHQLTFTDDELIRVEFVDYAKRHFLKSFEKKYKGRWELTLKAITDDLERIGYRKFNLQFTQRIDELKYVDEKWLFKYDFPIAGMKTSAKAAGNRLIGVLDANKRLIEVFLTYNKDDLPKNIGETEYIERVFRELYGEL